MKKPAPGYYRQLMPPNLSHIRIAIASQPMSGVVKVDNAQVLSVLDSSSDEYAKYYSEGLRNGSLITIVEQTSEKMWAPGELFLRS